MQGLIVHRAAAGGRTVGLARTTRALGDLRIDGEPVALAERRRVIAQALLGDDPTADGRPVDEHRWAWLRQVHGPSVAVVRPGEALPAGIEADALVTDRPGVLLAVHTADCAPVSFVDAAAGVVGVAHAGWRGSPPACWTAPSTPWPTSAPRRRRRCSDRASTPCYALGEQDLDEVAAVLGDEVRGTTASGAPALDLPAAVRTALARRQVPLRTEPDCTACGAATWYSHRARAEVGRMAHLTWIEP
ncbi:MAG: laccase domain-containing protein [Acidimicrobiales bacterium]